MPGTFEYCVLNGEAIINMIVLDEANAVAYSAAVGKTVVKRGKGVTIGDIYHDEKFWRVVPDVCEGGMTHDGETEPCAGGETLGTSHEEEITQ